MMLLTKICFLLIFSMVICFPQKQRPRRLQEKGWSIQKSLKRMRITQGPQSWEFLTYIEIFFSTITFYKINKCKCIF